MSGELQSVILRPGHKSERECFVARQVSPPVGKERWETGGSIWAKPCWCQWTPPPRFPWQTLRQRWHETRVKYSPGRGLGVCVGLPGETDEVMTRGKPSNHQQSSFKHKHSHMKSLKNEFNFHLRNRLETHTQAILNLELNNLDFSI